VPGSIAAGRAGYEMRFTGGVPTSARHLLRVPGSIAAGRAGYEMRFTGGVQIADQQRELEELRARRAELAGEPPIGGEGI
jgi:cell division protein FtsB